MGEQRADHALLAHLLVTGLEDEIGELDFQRPPGQAHQFTLDRRVHPAEGRGAQLVAAKLPRAGLDFPGGDALHIPLHERGHQCLLAALVTREKLRWNREKDVTDIRGILLLQADALDFPYIESWCVRHGTMEHLNEIRRSVVEI